MKRHVFNHDEFYFTRCNQYNTGTVGVPLITIINIIIPCRHLYFLLSLNATCFCVQHSTLTLEVKSSHAVQIPQTACSVYAVVK